MFASLFRQRRTWRTAQLLSRAVWSPRAASRQLLALLLQHFCPTDPIVLGLDDTLEHRRGKRIRAKGLYRDGVRSSPHQIVKATGLRWLSLMLLAPIPWARHVWALPFLTALAPSATVAQAAGHRPKTLAVWGRQLLQQTRRWLTTLAPGRPMIVVVDAAFTVLEVLDALRADLTIIGRLRWNIVLYAPAPPREPSTRGRPRKTGARLPSFDAVLADPQIRWETVTVTPWYGEHARTLELTSGTGLWTRAAAPIVPLRWVMIRDPAGHFEPQVLGSTDVTLSAQTIVTYFVQRWQVEVTFEESRCHLGVETQRQWSDTAIARTTPILLGLFSVVTLLATQLPARLRTHVRQAAWYPKPVPTFSDTLAAVRAACWATCLTEFSHTSHGRGTYEKIPPPFVTHLAEAFCYAA